MTRYVLGFMFNEDNTRVALIRKNRPEWQAGKLNGIGGKIEEGESILEAMVREFHEETGYLTEEWMWRKVAVMNIEASEALVHIFSCAGENFTLERLISLTDELVVVRECATLLRSETVHNLGWVLPLCLDEESPDLEITYK